MEIADEDGKTFNKKTYYKKFKIILVYLIIMLKVACIYDKPSICMLGNTYPNVCRPSNEAIMLHPDFSKIKPSFQNQEQPKRINEIKPEVIAQNYI